MHPPSKIGIREFRSGLAGFLAADAPVAITRHGQTVGYFIPAQALPTPESLAELLQAAARLDEQLASHALDGETLADEIQAERQARRQQAAAGFTP